MGKDASVLFEQHRKACACTYFFLAGNRNMSGFHRSVTYMSDLNPCGCHKLKCLPASIPILYCTCLAEHGVRTMVLCLWQCVQRVCYITWSLLQARCVL